MLYTQKLYRIDKPNKNGITYTREALENMVEHSKENVYPLYLGEPNYEERNFNPEFNPNVIGNCKNLRIESGYVVVDIELKDELKQLKEILYTNGACICVLRDDRTTNKDMRFRLAFMK